MPTYGVQTKTRGGKLPPAAHGLNKEKRDKITAQARQEIVFDRRYKQGKIRNWQKNEMMYYALKQQAPESRANIELGRMQEFVHRLWSHFDNPLIFKFRKRKDSQVKRVARLNALRVDDSDRDQWDAKDLLMKKQCIVYGRTQAYYYADSEYGYCPHLTPTDVYDFLIDPSGGGYDYELALNHGRYGVIKSKEDLLSGIDRGDYLKDEVEFLIQGTGNNTDMPQEEINKLQRTYSQNTIGRKENFADSDNKYKFWEWYTTWWDPETQKSERYYLVMHERAGRAVKVCKLEELIEPEADGTPLWPVWGYAAFMDLTEYWTPGFCDYMREIFMAQSVSMNQAFDNAEAINKPQKVVNVVQIENLASLKYRRDGVIKTKNVEDVAKAVQFVYPQSIDTPFKAFDKLEEIVNRTTGMTPDSKSTDGKEDVATIYEGNQKENAGLYGLFNKSYSFGYKRFAKLWQNGVREHLVKRVAVDILGPEGIEQEEFSRRDIFRKGEDFRVHVEASNAEEQAHLKMQEQKLKFVSDVITEQRLAKGSGIPPYISLKKSVELRGKIVGLQDEDIRELLSVDDYGSDVVMSEAAMDIEKLIDNEQVRPNNLANNAYRQRLKDYMSDHQYDMDGKTWARFVAYMQVIDPIVVRNEARAVQEKAAKAAESAPAPGPADGAPGAPGMPGSVPGMPTPVSSINQPVPETMQV